VIGVTVGLVIVAVIVWFAGLNKVWEQRKNNPKYIACIACCTSCRTNCQAGIASRRQASRPRTQPQPQPEARQSQPQQPPRREEIQLAEQSLQPSAPGFSEKPPPEYSAGVGFEPLTVDQPPPYAA